MIKRIIKIALGVLAGLFILWSFYFLYNKSKTVPVVFTSVQPQYRSIIKKTVATGTIVPKNETEIRPRVSGIIAELYVEAGKKISKGSPIAKIKIIPNMAELNASENRVKQAELTYGNTKIEFDRELALFDKGVIAKAEFQKYELALKQAKEELDAAQNNLSIVRDGVNKEAATASNTIVSSTIDGMILYVPVKVGHSVIEMNTFSPGTSIATVADMGEMEFQGKVDETEVGKIKNGMPLLITIGAIDGVQFDATLTYISPKGILENGAIQFDIKANVTLRNDFFIRSGYSANADIVIARKDSVLSIEEKNVIFDNMKTFVELRIDSTTFKKIPVELGISDGIYTEITKGLSLTDKVKVQQ